jgi:hypothetical protein
MKDSPEQPSLLYVKISPPLPLPQGVPRFAGLEKVRLGEILEEYV